MVFTAYLKQCFRSSSVLPALSALCLSTLLLMGAAPVTAQNSTPTIAIQTVVNNILNMLRNENFSLEENRERIKTEIASAFDARAMAQSVLSTNWRDATEEQQTEFQNLLLQTIEGTYIGRLEAYTNESVVYRDEEINNNRATVDTAIVTSSSEIPVNYKLRLRDNGWYVYDVEVENVSMVSSYRETYRNIVRRSGMDSLLTQMRDKIAELEQ